MGNSEPRQLTQTLHARTPRHQGKRSRRTPGPGDTGAPADADGPRLRPWSSGSTILRRGGVLR